MGGFFLLPWQIAFLFQLLLERQSRMIWQRASGSVQGRSDQQISQFHPEASGVLLKSENKPNLRKDLHAF